MTTASIVAFHNPPHELSRLLQCVIRSGIATVYLIDNSSDDRLKELSRMSDRIVYVHTGKNLGYGRAHNIAIKRAMAGGARYHVVLNPDIYWTGDPIGTLEQFMDAHADCGLVMPKVLYPDGTTQHLCKLLPTPMNLFGRRFVLSRHIQQRIDARFELHFSGYDRVMYVPSLSGCFMFMRTDALRKAGLFDERYFMYAEDLDLCRRIGEVSLTLFCPTASVFHTYEKGSYKDPMLLKYHIRSVIQYFNKWGWLFDRKRRMANRKCLEQFK